jgi:hypothetical protein
MVQGLQMISRADWYVFLIMALPFAVWAGGQLVEIKRELKNLREKIGKK